MTERLGGRSRLLLGELEFDRERIASMRWNQLSLLKRVKPPSPIAMPELQLEGPLLLTSTSVVGPLPLIITRVAVRSVADSSGSLTSDS